MFSTINLAERWKALVNFSKLRCSHPLFTGSRLLYLEISTDHFHGKHHDQALSFMMSSRPDDVRRSVIIDIVYAVPSIVCQSGEEPGVGTNQPRRRGRVVWK
jgi:hypothetical protein